jgi:glycerol uptake facilitator-like aquaporin
MNPVRLVNQRRRIAAEALGTALLIAQAAGATAGALVFSWLVPIAVRRLKAD